MDTHPLASPFDGDGEAFSQLRRAVDALLAKAGEFGVSLTAAAPSDILADVDASDELCLEQVDRTLESYFLSYHGLNQRQKQSGFTVAVLALAKSGKSTFLNALCGAQLLPMNNIPETARICRINHTPLAGGDEPVLYDASHGSVATTIVGEAAIRQHLTLANREVRTRQHQLSDEIALSINMRIESLASQGHLQDGVAFQLLDTPGPNESGEEALRFQVERMLDGVDAVLYLLDYTKLRTADEALLFERIKKINIGLVRRLSRRLFFVVNKMDTLRVSEGLGEDETREYVAELVTNQLADEGFQLRPEQVLLVSAQEALLSRLVLRDPSNSPPDVLRRFKERAFGSSRAVQRRAIPVAQLAEAAHDMAADSGMQEVEHCVFGFLYRHAGALKQMAILDDVARMLSQMDNSASVSESALQKEKAQLAEEAAALQAQLEDTLSRFDDVQAQTSTLEEEVVGEVRTRLGFLKERLVNHVIQVLNVAETEASAPPGRWRGIWEKARNFLGRRAAGAERDELQTTLQELHADIFAEIDQEVRSFWHDLETATNERQRVLLRRLNNHLEGLSRAIEAVVEERLAVRLEPVDLRLTPPSAQQFHSSLQRLFDTGIEQRSVVTTRERTVEYTVWEKRYRNGICRTGAFYVGRPATRVVEETSCETEYQLQPEKIKEYFTELISGTIDTSVRSVRAFVKQYLAATMESARDSITTYAERFTSSMLGALAASEQGERARLAALERVRAHKAALAALLAETATLQSQAESLFPAAAASMSRACSLQFDDDDLLHHQGDENELYEDLLTSRAGVDKCDNPQADAALAASVASTCSANLVIDRQPAVAEPASPAASNGSDYHDVHSAAGSFLSSLQPLPPHEADVDKLPDAPDHTAVLPPATAASEILLPEDPFRGSAQDAVLVASTISQLPAAEPAAHSEQFSAEDDTSLAGFPSAAQHAGSGSMASVASVASQNPSTASTLPLSPGMTAMASGDAFGAQAANSVASTGPFDGQSLASSCAFGEHSTATTVPFGVQSGATSVPLGAQSLASTASFQAQAPSSDQDPTEAATAEMATIELHGSTPASPAASATAESATSEDWSVIDDEVDEEQSVDVAVERRNLTDPSCR